MINVLVLGWKFYGSGFTERVIVLIKILWFLICDTISLLKLHILSQRANFEISKTVKNM